MPDKVQIQLHWHVLHYTTVTYFPSSNQKKINQQKSFLSFYDSVYLMRAVTLTVLA